MSATTTPTTFTDLQNALLNRVQVVLGTSTADSVTSLYAQSFLNQANHDFHLQRDWAWAERKGLIRTQVRYTTGLVTIALATRSTVTGTTSATVTDLPAWTTAVTGMDFNNARVGGKMTFAGANDVYEVSTVSDATTITLVDRYVQTTALTAGAYVYFEDEYTLASDFWRLVDARQFSSAYNIPVIGRRDFYQRYPRNSRSGLPRNCTIIELGPGATTDWRPRVIFHPAPDKTYNIPYRYLTRNLAVSSTGTGAVNMSTGTDEPIIPLRYRHVLIEYALYLWYRDLKDDQRATEAMGRYDKMVARIAADTDPQADHPRFVPRRAAYQSTGPRRRGNSRYSTGTAWDELRE